MSPSDHTHPTACSPVPLHEPVDIGLCGGKAAHLSEALRAGLPVPPGFALPVAMVDAIASRQSWAMDRLAALAVRFPVAARSSAIDEDSSDASFAGQHETVLGIRSMAELIDAVGSIWASARSPAAIAYRERLGLPPEPQMGAVVQELIDADVAGVLFSRNPVTGADERVIEATWGLGEAVVSGLVTPDRFRLAPDGTILECNVGYKDIAVRRDPTGGGTHEAQVPAHLVGSLCLTDAELADLHNLVRQCDGLFDGDHDIEWAFATGRLYLLQRRSLTALPAPENIQGDRHPI